MAMDSCSLFRLMSYCPLMFKFPPICFSAEALSFRASGSLPPFSAILMASSRYLPACSSSPFFVLRVALTSRSSTSSVGVEASSLSCSLYLSASCSLPFEMWVFT